MEINAGNYSSSHKTTEIVMASDVIELTLFSGTRPAVIISNQF